MTEGEYIGKYRIDGRLGTGAMGVVYRAFDPVVKRPVALKTIRKELLTDESSESLMQRFQNEATAAGRLLHPNIVTLFDFGEDADQAFIAMELVEGLPLNKLVPKGTRAGRRQVVNWVSQLLYALEYAHHQGIVHRDVKPGNLLVMGNQQLKIMDFGVARLDSGTGTQVGMIVGTPSYMAPEQIRGEAVDGRADLFSVGVILYELLTGNRPFRGDPTVVMHSIMTVTPQAPSADHPDLPQAFDEVILRSLAKDPGERFQDAREFRKALQAAYAASPAESAAQAGAPGATDAQSSPDGGEELFEVPLPSLPAIGVVRAPPAGAPASAGSAPRAGTGPGSLPQHGPASAGSRAAAASKWPAPLLEDVERSLLPVLGEPMAGVIVHRAAERAATLEDLSRYIVDHLGNDTARAAFLRDFNALHSRFVAKPGTAPGPIASDAPQGAVTAGQPAHADLGPGLLQEAERKLKPYIGPATGALLRRTAGKARDSQHLYAMLAEHILDADRRARFLKDVGLA